VATKGRGHLAAVTTSRLLARVAQNYR
jgi:hypothetical protein